MSTREDFRYGTRRTVQMTPAEAETRVRELLADEGFGILTEIDVTATFRKKLDVDFRPYRILGACNPKLAHQALSAEENIGLLLPCNVVVFADSPEGPSTVAILDPRTQLSITGRDDIEPLADEVAERMERVLERL